MSDVLTDADRELLKPLYERLSALKSRKRRVEHWAPNKRCVIEFEVPNDEIPETAAFRYVLNTDFAFRQNQTAVDHGAIFLCEEIEVIYSATGTAVTTGEPQTIVIAAPWRSNFVDFYLKFRDTGSDRDWQNDWIPGNLFQSANLGGLILGDEGHVLVSGGSTIIADLQVARNDDGATTYAASGLEDILTHRWLVSFIGCQIPLEGA